MCVMCICTSYCLTIARMLLPQILVFFAVLLSTQRNGTCTCTSCQSCTTLKVSNQLQGNNTCSHCVCKTLDDALMQIESTMGNESISGIFINVTSEQNLSTSRTYNFSASTKPLSIVVSGQPQQTVIRCSTQQHSMNIKLWGSYNLTWTWESLELYGCTPDSLHVHTKIIHHGFNSVIFKNCTVHDNYHIGIDKTINVVFKLNLLGNSDTCPSITVQQYKNMTYNMTFSHNTITRCIISDLSASILTMESYYPTNATLINNKLTHINRSRANTNKEYQFIEVSGKGIVYLMIKGNLFNENQVIFINLNIKKYPRQTSECVIWQNQFYSNNNQIELTEQGLIMLQYALGKSANLNITLRNNTFTKNKKFYLFHIKGSGDHKSTIWITIDEHHIEENNASSGLCIIQKIQPRHGIMKIDMQSLTAVGNRVNTVKLMKVFGSLSSILGIINIDGVHIANANFTRNLGTPLLIQTEQDLGYVILSISGNLVFSDNFGLLGGACGLQYVRIDISNQSILLFNNNHAALGGALYLVYSKLTNTSCNAVVNFTNNTAATAGNTIFFNSNPYDTIDNYSSCSLPNLTNNANSLASNLTLHPNTTHTIFPGQAITLNMSIVDFFNAPSSCTANVNLMCDKSMYTCFEKQIKLKGPMLVVIAQSPGDEYTIVRTNIMLSSPVSKDIVDTNTSMVFTCRNSGFTTLQVDLKITPCPLGFVYNQYESECQCLNLRNDRFFCSKEQGIACVSQGYWYNSTAALFGKCTYPNCVTINSSNQCPQLLNLTGNYFNLQYNQCSTGKGGFLCMGCASGYNFTFTSTICVPGDCSRWKPLLVIFVSLSSHVLIAVLALFLVRFKLRVGSGFLYGPMLFLAVINQIPFDRHPKYASLDKAVSIISSIPLMNLEVFGFIPWCFYPLLDRIYNYSLRYLGPMVVLLVMAIAAAISRWGPTSIRWWRGSPIRAICILILLSFWSLVDTSVHILRYSNLTNVSGNTSENCYAVYLKPELKYFSPQHLLVAIPAILLLLLVVVPLLMILLFSSLFSKRVNLHKIKPFLDEFQSCYKDRYRWFSIVFFVVWIAIVSIPSEHIGDLMQTMFAGILTVHVLLQPYRSKILNLTDTLLLINMNILQAIMQSKAVNSTRAIVIVHLITIGTLACLAAWFMCVCLYMSNICKRLPASMHTLTKWAQRPAHSRGHKVSVLDSSYDREESNSSLQNSVGEREPLIAIVNNQ